MNSDDTFGDLRNYIDVIMVLCTFLFFFFFKKSSYLVKVRSKVVIDEMICMMIGVSF